MTLKDFKSRFSVIESFLDEKKRIDSAVKLLCAEDFAGYCGIGDRLLCSYIELLSEQSGDKSGWIDWFVFENDMGKRRMHAGKIGKMRPIKSVTQLYNLITK